MVQKRILVTGAVGFIGSSVVQQLTRADVRVVGVDNLNDAYDVRLKEWRLTQLRDTPNFEFERVDICHRDALRSLFAERFDAVINLAARAGVRDSLANPWIYFDTNVTGTLNLLELCREFGVTKFVLASSSSLYGTHNPSPFREDANTDSLISPYAASKKAAETLCSSYHHLYGIDTTVLRYFTVYGPAGRPDMALFRFVQWISEARPVSVYGDGSQSRDFTYIDDIARGTVSALQPLGFEIINLGSDHPVVLMDAIRLVEQAVGKQAILEYKPRHIADVPATWADVSKAKSLLGWQAETQLSQGIARLVDWYRANGVWARELKTE